MSEPIYSPDGSMVWNGTTWVAVETKLEDNSLAAFARSLPTASDNNQNLAQSQPYVLVNVENTNADKIENLARVMIDKLNRGDMATAKECWNRAKMIDLHYTYEIFEKKYAYQIADGYFQVALSELNSFRGLYDNPMTISVQFRIEVEAAPTLVKLALENSTAFVPGQNSFDYNYLYSVMWLYCRRFDLVWNREQCQKNFESYFGLAYKLANSSAEYNQLRDLRDMWKDQMREIKSETKSIVFYGIIVALGWVFFMALVLN